MTFIRNTIASTIARHSSRLITALATVILVSACSGGAETQVNPVTSIPGNTGYNGPAPATAEVQDFKLNLWDNIQAEAGCGDCHGAGGQSPTFARTDDINLAYEAANGAVDLTSPADSRLVTKVLSGHNCWSGSDSVCGDLMTTWITGWAGDLVAGGGRTIQLDAPTIKDPGTSKNFPADAALFASTVHPLLVTYCQDCHTSNSAAAQSPYFAEGDLGTAYEAAKPKIKLDSPVDSRLVVRLREEFHNCWDDCLANASEMQAQITAMANSITPTEVDPTLTVSKALTILDGVVAAGGSRYEASAIATYEFKTGEDAIAYDTSGVSPAMDLTLSGDVSWVGGWGITIQNGKAQARTADSRKLHDLIKSTGEYAIEAWVVPANVAQEESRIVSYSAGPDARNFTLGQTLYNYDFSNRSGATDANGMAALSTPDADEVLQASLQHVVANFSPVEGRSLYVNGELINIDDNSHIDCLDGGADNCGSIADWDDTFAFVLGNEVSGDGVFAGTFRFVSIHNRVLTDAQVLQNFDAGVGEKFFLLFSVSHLIDVPEAYVLMQVSQFDNFGYLFNAPHFITLDPTASFAGIPLQGIRVGINGAEASVGQAFRTVDLQLDSTQMVELGQPLSPFGTVFAQEKGADADEFFLTFDVLGDNLNVRTDPVPLAPPPAANLDPVSDIGIRTFEEIDATMSQATGVSRSQPDVRTTYELVRQQLPSNPDFGGFVSAHQVGVAQLAVEYCNALINDQTLRGQVFAGFNFNAAASTAFGSQANRDLLIDPIVDRVVGVNLASQPDRADIEGELNNLIDRLTTCGGSCEASRTETVGIAVCSAALGSATMLVQ